MPAPPQSPRRLRRALLWLGAVAIGAPAGVPIARITRPRWELSRGKFDLENIGTEICATAAGWTGTATVLLAASLFLWAPTNTRTQIASVIPLAVACALLTFMALVWGHSVVLFEPLTILAAGLLSSLVVTVAAPGSASTRSMPWTR